MVQAFNTTTPEKLRLKQKEQEIKVTHYTVSLNPAWATRDWEKKKKEQKGSKARAEDKAQLVEHLLSLHEALGLTSSTEQLV